jgi:hypothetical protein
LPTALSRRGVYPMATVYKLACEVVSSLSALERSAEKGSVVSLQVAILKVLASYPDGKATLAAMKNDLAILAGSGLAWSQRLTRLAARVPDLDIFSQALVRRDDAGWELTAAGREVLRSIEEPLPDTQAPAPGPILMAVPLVVIERPRPAGARGRNQRRGRGVGLARSA